MIKIAIIGFGVVGSGVYEVIRKNAASITENVGTEIDIKYILDIRDFSDHPESNLFVKDLDVILKDDEVKIVVETMGGLEPANTFTRRVLSAGKYAVTSNKELVATYGDELFALAKENHCGYLYEASVGGGIPIIRPLRECLAANQISSIAGILNGTTNYILTKMFKDNLSYETALAEAREKGYAEKDPSADVDGLDTGKKICILASMLNGEKINHADVYTEGIRNITLKDVELANKLGYSIKLIGKCTREDDQFAVLVAPMLVPQASPLAGIDDVFNGIMVSGNMVGDAMFYGRGAGKLPTASAVVADVMDIAKNREKPFKAPWNKASKNVLVPHDAQQARFFIRVQEENKQKLLDAVDTAFSAVESIFTVGKETVLITPNISVAALKEKLAVLGCKTISAFMILD